MPEFAVESNRQPMLATGIVHPVMEWAQNADGKRHKTDQQERDPDTGMPRWDLEVLYTGSNFGQDVTITASVTVGAPDKPSPSPLTPVTFTGLSVPMWVNKAGGLSESWSAEALADVAESSSKSTPTSSAGSSSSKSASSAAA